MIKNNNSSSNKIMRNNKTKLEMNNTNRIFSIFKKYRLTDLNLGKIANANVLYFDIFYI